MVDGVLLTLAADIISAHVSYNSVPAAQLPQLIETVYGSLAGLGQTAEPVPETRTPAVSVRASVKPDGIVCLECGGKFKTLKRHLAADHQLSVEEYRARWNLPTSYPIVSAEYSERRRALAKEIGLSRKKGAKNKSKKVSAAATKAASKPAAIADAALPVTAPPARKAAAKPKGTRKPKSAAKDAAAQ